MDERPDIPGSSSPSDPGSDATADSPGPETTEADGGAHSTWLPWSLVAVLTVLLLWAWLGVLAPLQADETRRDQATLAMVDFLSQLTNWDASDGLGATQDALLELGTEGFRTEVGAVFESMDDLIAVEMRSSAVIDDLFVQQVEGDTAVLFGVVTQTFTSNQPGEPSVVRRFWRATLVKQEGAWLVQGLDLVHQQQVSGASPGTPNIGSTLPGESTPDTGASGQPIDDTAEGDGQGDGS